MNEKFTIVIVTYNRLELLKECIQSAFNQTLRPYKVVVVDNASTDGTGVYLAEQEKIFDNLIVDTSPSNLGGAGGFHRGLEVASLESSDWVVLIDDDAMLCSEYLETIAKYSSLMPNVKAFSGTVMTDGVVITDHRKRIYKGWHGHEEKVSEVEYKQDSFEYDLSSFCGITIHQSIIDAIGLPMKDFFIWCDDTEYSLRIRKETSIVNINSIWLNHKTKLNSVSVSEYSSRLNWKRYYGFRNKTFTCLKYGYKAYIVKYDLRAIKHIISLKLHKKVEADICDYNLHMVMRGVLDGVKGKLGKNPKYIP